MIAEFAVQHEGERVEGQTSPLSVVETEAKFDLGITTLFLGESPRMTALYWLMWRSLHPDGSTADDREFHSWLAGLEGFEVGEAVESALPPPMPR